MSCNNNYFSPLNVSSSNSSYFSTDNLYINTSNSNDFSVADNDVSDLIRDSFGLFSSQDPSMSSPQGFGDTLELDQNLSEILEDLRNCVKKNETHDNTTEQNNNKAAASRAVADSDVSVTGNGANDNAEYMGNADNDPMELLKELEFELETERIEKLRNPKFQTMPAYQKRQKQEAQWRAAIKAARKATTIPALPYQRPSEGEGAKEVTPFVPPLLPRRSTKSSLDLTSLDLPEAEVEVAKDEDCYIVDEPRDEAKSVPIYRTPGMPPVRTSLMMNTKKHLSSHNHFPANSRIFNRSLQELQNTADAISKKYLNDMKMPLKPLAPVRKPRPLKPRPIAPNRSLSTDSSLVIDLTSPTRAETYFIRNSTTPRITPSPAPMSPLPLDSTGYNHIPTDLTPVRRTPSTSTFVKSASVASTPAQRTPSMNSRSFSSDRPILPHPSPKVQATQAMTKYIVQSPSPSPTSKNMSRSSLKSFSSSIPRNMSSPSLNNLSSSSLKSLSSPRPKTMSSPGMRNMSSTSLRKMSSPGMRKLGGVPIVKLPINGVNSNHLLIHMNNNKPVVINKEQILQSRLPVKEEKMTSLPPLTRQEPVKPVKPRPCYNCLKLSKYLPYLGHNRRKELAQSGKNRIIVAFTLLCEACGLLIKETVLYGGNKIFNSIDNIDLENCPVFFDNIEEVLDNEEDGECQNFIRIRSGYY